MAFLEDPRLRQRWNQIAQDAEAATENAAAGIWSIQHNYINPCFEQLAHSIESCTNVCIGHPDDRLRRRRERDREAELNFDFYDDWYETADPRGDGNAGGGSGLFSTFRGEDWDRLLAGTGSTKKHTATETSEQPRRKRGMSYGTKGGRRKTTEDDPTIIPSTQPIGFLSKLPWRMGGTLRYKPSAADLQDHPQKDGYGEAEPLLASDGSPIRPSMIASRKRSATTGSGDTSDSYRSRGDLFPSDGEGEEDAIALDDDVTFDMLRKDDRSSGKSRSSKGKRRAGLEGSRNVSRTTLDSVLSIESNPDTWNSPQTNTPDHDTFPSLEYLKMEEQRLMDEEEAEILRKREAAADLAAERGLDAHSQSFKAEHGLELGQFHEGDGGSTVRDLTMHDDHHQVIETSKMDEIERRDDSKSDANLAGSEATASFIPARLPTFG